MSLEALHSILLEINPEERWLCHVTVLGLIFWVTAILFSTEAERLSALSCTVQGLESSAFPSALVIFCLFGH